MTNLDALKKAFGQYGRRGDDTHILLNGKDADLDRGGQCRVEIVDMDWEGVIYADVNCYASIVPSDDHMDEAEAIVMDDWGFPGEWDGDYWVFGTGVFRIKLDAPCEVGTDDDAPLWAEALYKAITEHPTVRQFERRMCELHDAIAAIN